MTPLAVWAAIVDAPVLGKVGHHRTHEAGPAHPQGKAPAWVVPGKGCDLVKLHRAFCAIVVYDRRGEARECEAGPARVTRKRQARQTGTVLRMARRTA